MVDQFLNITRKGFYYWVTKEGRISTCSSYIPTSYWGETRTQLKKTASQMRGQYKLIGTLLGRMDKE